MKYIKDVIKAIFIIFISYIVFVIFDNSFNIFSKFKIIYIIAVILILLYLNIDNIKIKKESVEEKKDLFNIYYVNFPKVYEIAMLIDNKIKTLIEKNTKDINTSEISTKVNFLHSNKILNPSLEFNADSQTSKSIEYKEVQEVKNTNSTILKIVKEKADKISNLKSNKKNKLILIENVKISIINKEEILQVNSMVSGALKDNFINTDADGQNLKIDLNALSTIFLKDYKYQLCCETTSNEKFYISIPMKLEKEFENDYSIFDLEIGRVNILGIYRDKKYKPSNKTTWNIIQEDNNYGENLLNQMKDSNEKSDNSRIETEYNEHPYIDLIAILQDIDINGDKDEEKNL